MACCEIRTEAILPWDHLDMGVTKAYLLKEMENSQKGKFTPGSLRRAVSKAVNAVGFANKKQNLNLKEE